MSYELEYFPPRGTSCVWCSKALNYSPWICILHTQKEPKLSFWPANVKLIVDLIKGRYRWIVQVTDWSFKRTEFKGWSKDPLKACLKAEQVGEAELSKLLPDWVRTALANNWRPPC